MPAACSSCLQLVVAKQDGLKRRTCNECTQAVPGSKPPLLAGILAAGELQSSRTGGGMGGRTAVNS